MIAMGLLEGEERSQSASDCGSTARIMSESSSSCLNAAFIHHPKIARYLAASNDVDINATSCSLTPSSDDCIAANTPYVAMTPVKLRILFPIIPHALRTSINLFNARLARIDSNNAIGEINVPINPDGSDNFNTKLLIRGEYLVASRMSTDQDSTSTTVGRIDFKLVEEGQEHMCLVYLLKDD